MTLPWFNITALLHEGSNRIPQTVEDGKVIGNSRSICVVFYVPLKWTKSAHKEQNNTHTNVGKDDAHPDFIGERVHE